jgi:amidase
MPRYHHRPSAVVSLQDRFVAGTLSAVSLLRHYHERIATYDKLGPCINAVSELNPDALADAERLDRERSDRGPRSLLHGIPVIVKDNINTRDRLNTSLGSHYLLGVNQRRDARVVARLRAAGAIVLGKSNMDELASGNGTPSARGGQIRNPYCPTRNASGSSGGSAAAVAAEFCTFALGTDTQSSVRFPAADCSLVAVRPTIGLLPSLGVFPGLATIDVPGPMAMTVTDAAIALRYLAGSVAVLDATTAWMIAAAKRRLDQRGGDLAGVRVGVMTSGLLGYHAGVDAAIDGALAAFDRAGATLVEVAPIALVDYGGPDEADRQVINAYDNLALLRYFDTLPRSMPERCFDRFRAIACLSSLPTSIANLKGPLRAPAALLRRYAVPRDRYHAARRRFFASQRQQIADAFRRHRLDVLVFPTKSVPATSVVHADDERVPHYRQECLASYAGLPEVTVPAGYADGGLPVGLSFVGAAWSEARLLRYAYAFEQTVNCWRPPRLSSKRPLHACALPVPPPNDAFRQASTLAGTQGRIHGNNLLARIEPFEPRHGVRHATDRSVWFRWEAPEDTTVAFWLEERRSAFHVLAIYVGDALSRLQEVVCTNYDGVDPWRVSFAAERGRAYHLAIASGERIVGSGEFVLRWDVGV